MSPPKRDESLPETAPSAHSGFSEVSLGLYDHPVVIRPKMSTLNTTSSDGTIGKSCATDLRGSRFKPAGQLLVVCPKVNFHDVFSVLTKNLCRHSSLVRRPCIKPFVRRPRCCFPRLRPPDFSNGCRFFGSI